MTDLEAELLRDMPQPGDIKRTGKVMQVTQAEFQEQARLKHLDTARKWILAAEHSAEQVKNDELRVADIVYKCQRAREQIEKIQDRDN